MGETGEDHRSSCLRCGGQAESGNLTAGLGWPGGGGRLAWMGGPVKLRYEFSRAEPMAQSWRGLAHVPAHRCRSCGLVWFDAPEPDR